jgi:hypothetical protein
MRKVSTAPISEARITASELRRCHEVLGGSLDIDKANLVEPLIELITRVLESEGE